MAVRLRHRMAVQAGQLRAGRARLHVLHVHRGHRAGQVQVHHTAGSHTGDVLF